jgi:hypothetical protein
MEQGGVAFTDRLSLAMLRFNALLTRKIRNGCLSQVFDSSSASAHQLRGRLARASVIRASTRHYYACLVCRVTIVVG